MTEKAPMPPWWVVQAGFDEEAVYMIFGGRTSSPVEIMSFYASEFSNARELADLIVQRTKQ